MSLTYSFGLTLDIANNLATVETGSTGHSQSLELPEGGVPYYFMVDSDPEDTAELAMSVLQARTFDPARALPCRVLELNAWIDERNFDTQDNAHYVIQLTNTSQYYVAQSVELSLTLTDSSGQSPPALPNGQPSLELVPTRHSIRCIDPGATVSFAALLVARGAPPGTYRILVSVRFRQLYWDGHDAAFQSSFDLPVQSDLGENIPCAAPAASKTAPSNPSPSGSLTLNRSNNMSGIKFKTNLQTPATTKKPKLKPIEFELTLPVGEGNKILGSYALVKGRRNKSSEDCTCIFGVNPDSELTETNFQTEDVATLRVTLTNIGNLNLRHVNVKNISIHGDYNGDGQSEEVTFELYDGNLIFDITPRDSYFCDVLPAGKDSCGQYHSVTKEFAVVTRGVHDGLYSVHMELHYDVEWCMVPLDLPITVIAD